MSFFEALLSNPLLLSALLAGFASSVVSGIIGSYVVVKRIVFISGSIAHSVLGGIGLCVFLERVKGVTFVSPFLGALIAGVISALLIGWISLHYKEREDSVIAALWSIGMALGVLFIAQAPGFNVELNNFLIGNILWVSPEDIWVLLGLDVLLLIVVFCLHKRFLALCFDEDQARLQGVPVNFLYLLLLVLTAIAVVLLIQIVGVILVITMLALPPAIANLFTTKLSKMMGIATFLSCGFYFFGTWAAFHFDWPGGATIALVSGLAYVIALFRPFSKLYSFVIPFLTNKFEFRR